MRALRKGCFGREMCAVLTSTAAAARAWNRHFRCFKCSQQFKNHD